MNVGLLMRRLLLPAWMLLRRRCCSGPLLLLGVALFLFYHTLLAARNRLRLGPQSAAEPRGRKTADDVLMEAESQRLISTLEALQRRSQVRSGRPPPLRHRQQAVVLAGLLRPWDPEVQLYQQLLQEMQHDVQLSTFAESSSFLRSGAGGWSLLLCLSSAEPSCLRRVSFPHLQPHQRVNLLPEVMQAFSDAGGGTCLFLSSPHLTGAKLPIRPQSCGSANQRELFEAVSQSEAGAPPPALVAMVNVFVLVTSVEPLTSFLHDIAVVTTHLQPGGQLTQLHHFLLQQLGPAGSHKALQQVRLVVDEVLRAALLTNEKQPPPSGPLPGRCVWCYQLLTFTLFLSPTHPSPVVIQVDTSVVLSALNDTAFQAQITRDHILEDTMHFLLPPPDTHSDTHLDTQLSSQTQQYGGCRGTRSWCLSESDFLLLLQFQRQVKTHSAFQLLSPSVLSASSFISSSSSTSSHIISELQLRIYRHYERQRNISRSDAADGATNQSAAQPSAGDGAVGRCVDSHLRQIYTAPPMALAPPFSPQVKVYHAEVTFDTVMVRIRPEPVSPACRVHLDEQRGPRMVNYPLGLGDTRISILVTDDSGPQPVVMATYTLHVHRDGRPSLPMFGDHVTCGFLQDCNLPVLPDQPCGLQPFTAPQILHTCSSGHTAGQWVVPCLSCSDNRTCDWRAATWQPDGCYHPLVQRPLLQRCLMGRKLLFIGDSTNRGMMYFLLERLNSSLEAWAKVHDLLVYRDLNGGQTGVSYLYYPQFWLEKKKRPTFRQALLQLLHRSQPLVNSHLTVLVVGGVQWLSSSHLRTVREVLDRESLQDILVVVKSLGMGFHLPVDGIRSLSLREVQQLHGENSDIIDAAKHHGYEAIDTLSITMGRHKEFLQGKCACHFHQVVKVGGGGASTANRAGQTRRHAPGLGSQLAEPEHEAWPKASSYHVRGAVNQVYSEILLSRLCPSG